ncbi:MAG: sulfate ABC transporter substrate-binding protein [Deltaproteobacteria bacterium]|jgi:sulfate transport system substrate-binding protein|nr:sulfate ABC transporter substrate-binding protein [Deltaproteobacteria bacterium]
MFKKVFSVLALAALMAFSAPLLADRELINVSYDPTRELYEVYNAAFQKYWQQEKNETVTIVQSHGGSAKQARSVIEGNEADVVTLALASDITAIEDAGLIEKGWQAKLPNNSSPYTSTIVFLVRKGNPKNIKDWGDLAKEGIGVITPNPKTSGGARWNYLAAWAWADNEYKHDEKAIIAYIKKVFDNVLVLDSGARGSTNTFVQNGQGDVLLAWENEGYLSLAERPGEFELVTPPTSILAEPPVAVVDTYVEKKKSRELATEYLKYLYSDEAQRMAGNHYYRPSNPEIRKEFTKYFDLNVKLITIDDPLFGGWDVAQKKHFSDGGVFDQIYAK